MFWFDDFSMSYCPLMNYALYIAHSSCERRNYLTIENSFIKLNNNVFLIMTVFHKQGQNSG